MMTTHFGTDIGLIVMDYVAAIELESSLPPPISGRSSAAAVDAALPPSTVICTPVRILVTNA